ncbi:hypothetical protein KCV05_g15528, partial [Aureobasidium melanogenum]
MSPKIVYVTLNELENPVSRAAADVEAKYLETRTMCQNIIADLRCLQKVYALEPKHFDRDTICKHLKEVLVEYRMLRNDASRFASKAEYEDFLATMYTLTAEAAQVIRSIKRRDQVRLNVQKETVKDIADESNPHRKLHLPPWSQFLAPGSPSFVVARFLSPFETRPPSNPSFPDYRRVIRTSYQTLPQAAAGILAVWTAEFQQANDYFHQRYPEEREFAGPVHQKLIPFRQMNLTPTGLKTEALRFHNLGNHPYAQAIEQVNGQGLEETATLGRFLGELDGQDVMTPFAANRCYVIRRWVLGKMES